MSALSMLAPSILAVAVMGSTPEAPWETDRPGAVTVRAFLQGVDPQSATVCVLVENVGDGPVTVPQNLDQYVQESYHGEGWAAATSRTVNCPDDRAVVRLDRGYCYGRIVQVPRMKGATGIQLRVDLGEPFGDRVTNWVEVSGW